MYGLFLRKKRTRIYTRIVSNLKPHATHLSPFKLKKTKWSILIHGIVSFNFVLLENETIIANDSSKFEIIMKL